MEWKIPLTEPDIGIEEIEAVTQVLESKWLTMGPVTAEFEKMWAEKMGVKHALAVNNCTAALHLANLALGIQSGDEVICPTLSFVATANATRYTGARLSFADVISSEDLTIDPDDIASKITPRTKAISLVHYAGFPCKMDEILALAREHNLKIIEDCAHAPFAWHQFRDGNRLYVGAIGDVGCFSFFGNKNITTGEGGMITTDDDGLAENIRLLRSHGMTTLTYDRYKGHASGYDVVMLGYNYRMDELHAAIGIAQLAKVERLNASRRQVYQWYLDAVAEKPGVTIPFAKRNLESATCHIVPAIIQMGGEQARDRLRQAGIQTSKHYDPIHGFSIYRTDRVERIKFSTDDLITLPISPFMTREQVEWVASFL
jgi:dTDP-4-amino-4,6-dideoxygalactose transaminase